LEGFQRVVYKAGGKGPDFLHQHNIDEDLAITPFFKGERTTTDNKHKEHLPELKQTVEKTDASTSSVNNDSKFIDNSCSEEETETQTDPSSPKKSPKVIKNNKKLTDHRAVNTKAILERIQKNKEEQNRHQRNLSKVTLDAPSILHLKEQGIEFNDTEWQDIPPWSQITSIYGDEPVILGLETCKEYQNSVPAEDRVVAPARNFNTGTNLFSYFFGKNCQGLSDRQVVQVPWGKHNLAKARLDGYRVDHAKYYNLSLESVLPVVLTRHPVSWMFRYVLLALFRSSSFLLHLLTDNFLYCSTCRHSYAAYWNHTDKNCPHLYNENKSKFNTIHVAYGYRMIPGKKYHLHRTLVHFWKEWYQSYAGNLPFPRVIVRLEDIVYQPAKVLSKLCECAGGIQTRSKMLVPEESVKVRRDRMRNKTGLPGSLVRGKETAGLVKAWKEHASIHKLWDRISHVDKSIVQEVLPEGKGLLQLFNYKNGG
jgi:hypothetical protein